MAICSVSPTLRGRPNLVPLARDAARLSAVRSLISSRSYSASDPRTPIIIRPAGVEESMPVGDRHQGDASLGQFPDGLQDVKHIATQSVELPHHHGVAVAHVLQEGSQPRPVISGTRHHVGEDFGDPSRDEGIVLLIQRLGDSRDSGVSDARARENCCRGFTLTHNCGQREFRDRYF